MVRGVGTLRSSGDGASRIRRWFFLALFAIDVVMLSAFLAVPGLYGSGSSHVPMLVTLLVMVLAASIVLWRYPGTLRWIERVIAVVLAVGVTLPPAQALLSGAAPVDTVQAVTRFEMWAPLVYVVAYLVFGTRVGKWVAGGFFWTSTLLVAAAAAEGAADVSTTAQYVLASVTYIVVLHLFALVLERAVRTKARAEVAAQYAFKDPLTGLGNRLLLQERLEQAREGLLRNGNGYALCMLDLDDFKSVNDRYGHQGGDELLAALGIRLATAIRGIDTVVRLGGDEFAVIGAEVEDAAAAEALALRILRVFEAPFVLQDRGVSVSGTVGVCLAGNEANDPAAILARADAAMYQAKRLGKARFALYRGGMEIDAGDAADLEGPLGRALDRGELDVHYQPLYDLGSGVMVGVEALLRWRHPTLGEVPPGTFIPVAEQTGLIHELGAWVLATACRQAAHWQIEGRPPLRLAVNVSSVQFAGRDFPAVVRRELADSGLSPELLELEITERVVTQESVLEALAALREIGVRVALDDFGTGYSSLGRLQDLPIDGFKIDRSFVGAVQSPRNATKTALALLQTMVSLAEGLGLSVVAEGVETAPQIDALRATGCHVAQGFLLARPMPADGITALLKAAEEAA